MLRLQAKLREVNASNAAAQAQQRALQQQLDKATAAASQSKRDAEDFRAQLLKAKAQVAGPMPGADIAAKSLLDQRKRDLDAARSEVHQARDAAAHALKALEAEKVAHAQLKVLALEGSSPELERERQARAAADARATAAEARVAAAEDERRVAQADLVVQQSLCSGLRQQQRETSAELVKERALCRRLVELGSDAELKQEMEQERQAKVAAQRSALQAWQGQLLALAHARANQQQYLRLHKRYELAGLDSDAVAAWNGKVKRDARSMKNRMKAANKAIAGLERQLDEAADNAQASDADGA